MIKQINLSYKTDIDTLRGYNIYLNSIILDYSDVKIEGLTVGQLQEHLNKLSLAKACLNDCEYYIKCKQNGLS